jgi:hypothetical protein
LCSFFFHEFSWSLSREVFNEATSATHETTIMYSFSRYFPTGFFGVLMRHGLIVVFAQGGVLRIPLWNWMGGKNWIENPERHISNTEVLITGQVVRTFGEQEH